MRSTGATASISYPGISGQFTLWGDSNDSSVYRDALTHGQFDTHIAEVMKAVIKPTDVCLDIGANIGVFSVLLSQLAPTGHVFAFEASPTISELLSKSVSGNGCTNVTVLNKAVSVDSQPLYVDCASDYQAGSYVSTKPESSASVSTESVSVDQFVAARRVKPTFMKIDVEGWEEFVLEGAMQTIESRRPTLIIEFNTLATVRSTGRSLKDQWKFLKRHYKNIYAIFPSGNRRIISYRHLDLLLRDAGMCDLLCIADDRELNFPVPSLQRGWRSFAHLQWLNNPLHFPPRETIYNWSYELRPELPDVLHSGELIEIPVGIINKSQSWFGDREVAAVIASYQWLKPGMEMYVAEGRRSTLPRLRPHSNSSFKLGIETPDTPGDFLLRISLLQEGRSWAYLLNPSVDFLVPIKVS